MRYPNVMMVYSPRPFRDENPYQSPAGMELAETAPKDEETLPHTFLRRKVTVEEFSEWGDSWESDALRRTIRNVRMQKLFNDGPYRSLLLRIPKSQRQPRDYSLFFDGMELNGARNFVLQPDGRLTFQKFSWPWYRYRLTLEPTLSERCMERIATLLERIQERTKGLMGKALLPQ